MRKYNALEGSGHRGFALGNPELRESVIGQYAASGRPIPLGFAAVTARRVSLSQAIVE
jgi:hypothetical protein